LEKYQDSIVLKIPNKLCYLPLVLDNTAAFARILGLNDKKTNEVLLAVKEAVVNVIDHAFMDGEQASFELIFQKIDMGMQILIREQGMPFDPIALAEMAQKETFGVDDTRGGLHLMSKFMDEVSFVNMGKAGKEIRLVKYWGTIPEIMASPEDDVPRQAADIPAYEIREMLPHEAIEVSKCAYMTFGYSYSNEQVYYPERLRQLNEEGQMLSLVAASEDNEIMGHICLFFKNDYPLIGFVDNTFVKPQYRESGCQNRLGQALVVWAKAHGLKGLYGWVVTNHTYTQKLGLKLGFSDTAILISDDMPYEFKDNKAEVGQRESETVMFIYLSPMNKAKIYAPLHHADMISQIYGHLGVSTEVFQPDSRVEKLNEKTVLELEYDPSLIAFLTIKEYGLNVTGEVGRMLKKLCLERIETIYLALPLNCSHTAVLTSEFEKLGFFFCGIMPRLEGKDQLILQYLNNQIINYNQIRIYTEIGQILLDYIKRLDPNQMK
jgi:serine/threonine-protein kinase RsbW